MTRISKIILAVSVTTALLGTGQAAAKQTSLKHMPVTGRTSQPIGHYEYCQQYSADCLPTSPASTPVKLTRAKWSELDKVNLFANHSVKPVTDFDYYNVEEYWTYPDSYGDCEDYVLLKRQILMEKGWPASSLLITVVRQPNGDGHAVLTVRTDHGDFVLDNLRDKILPWYETEYRFLKRQSSKNAGRWESIQDSRTGMVGSIN